MRVLAVGMALLMGCDATPPPAPGSTQAATTQSVTTASATAVAPVTASVSVSASASAIVATTTSASASAPVVSEAPPEGMVPIKAGIFLMGSPMGNGNPEERPMHERVVGAFFLDETEVTTSAYLECVKAGKCRSSQKPDQFCNEHMKDHGAHPINCIDFADATNYCAFVGKRLPSEAEWEYAASGGDGRTFSWGETNPTTKIACFSHPGGTCPVKTFAAGAFGLYDMSGNVWEWTSSWFGLFPNEEPADGKRRVFKGGSWSRRWPKWLRVRNRSHWEPNNANSWLGIRCAKTKLPLECPAESEARGEKCVRSSGKPLCEPKFGWNGKACTRLDSKGVPSPVEEKRAYDPSEVTDPTEAISMSRTPKDDGDCQKNYRNLPAAYRWQGNTWEARVKLVKARGCTRRDNGTHWVSACCRE